MRKLFMLLCLVILCFWPIHSVLGIVQGGNNVCGEACTEAYYISTTVDTDCGVGGWSRCATSQKKVAYRTATCYKCCEGWSVILGGSANCDIASCFSLSPGECLNGGNCVRPDECNCPSGTTPPMCRDVDECLENNGGCEENCVNTVGSYNCACNSPKSLRTDMRSCAYKCYDQPAGACPNGGACVGVDVCECAEGTTMPRCDDIDECIEPDLCEHTCVNELGSYRCTCPTGFSVSEDDGTCIAVCFSYPAGTCSNDHKCVDPDTCSCSEGFELPFCADVDECANALSNDCQQECQNTVGMYNCDCVPGYTLTEDSITCEDLNECLEDNGGCSEVCDNIPGSRNCSCSLGYQLAEDGVSCNDMDECSSGNHTCDSLCEDSGNHTCNHTCVNTVGSYKCTCVEGLGWSSTDNICLPVCFEEEPGVCPNQGRCNSTGVCECQPGYGFNNCSDIDECSENNGGCKFVCNNEAGSFFCSCFSGYSLVLDTCQDINECEVNTSLCELGCNNIDGSYTCNCTDNYGWDNKTMTCKPLCFGAPPGECLYGGTCLDVDKCSCLEGFSLPECQDIDECNGDVRVCDLGCHNIPGSYTCDCEDDYSWMSVPKSCKAVCDDNEPGVCPNGGVCSTPGVCACADGYEGPQCTDIDECTLGTAGCDNVTCENLPGSFRCNCETGFVWNSQHGSCLADCGEGESGMCPNDGTCQSPGTCLCAPGFIEPSCTDVDECSGEPQCSNGCVNLNGSYYCLGEEPGYGIIPGQDKQKPVCFSELPGVCPNGGACVQPDLCNCPSGYESPLCTDIDECTTGVATCTGDCVNLPGSYYCSSAEGYGRLPGETVDKAVCYHFVPGLCPHGGECVSPGICTCLEGYKTPQCTDKNECLTNNGGCEKECVNIPGSSFCQCWQGYGHLPSQTDCKPICRDSLPGTCPNGGTCTSPSVCSCAQGFEPPLCTDVNECIQLNGGCDLKCFNKPGSYSCECKPGFGWDTVNKICQPVCFGMSPGICLNGGECTDPEVCFCPPKFQTENCADKDECSQIDTGCEFGCVNEVSGYYCQSDQPGYGRIAGSDIDMPLCFENSPGQCGNGGTCLEPDVCSCLPGFQTGNCQDIDECLTAVCEKGCVNVPGTYYCLGEPGYGKAPGDEIFKPLCDDQMPGECPNGGTCIRPGVCMCEAGFQLPACNDINECNGDNSGGCGENDCQNTVGSYKCICPTGLGWNEDEQQCLPVCFDLPPGQCAHKGTCVKENVCTCPQGYSEPDCSEINECTEMSVDCTHGCENTVGSYYCASQTQGYGRIPGTSEDLPVCYGQLPGQCKNGGECVQPDNCTCPRGYSTADCSDMDECSLDNGGCELQCTNTEGSYHCECGRRYAWDTVQNTCLAVCYGEEPGKCANNGSCMRPWICSCKPGFNTPSCSDIDECAMNNGGCGDLRCQNQIGSYYCDCLTGFGWHSAEHTCKAVCFELEPGVCPNGGECTSPGVCTCLRGFTSSNCTDINECEVENGDCINVECVNIVGSHYCKTDSGHGTLPGETEQLPLCSDLPPGNCPNDGTCKSPESCDCQHGFSPPHCDDYDECLDNGLCELECHNTHGSYYCDCHQGYQWDYVNNQCKPECFDLPGGICPNEGVCVRPGVCTCATGYKTPDCSDIDECSTDSSTCELGCHNEIGSYSCDCNTGYQWQPESMSCSPVCFGLVGKCENGGLCESPDSCVCSDGFQKPQCLDIDECSLDEPVCASGQCTNLVGSYKCGCDEGFDWSLMEGSCQAVCGSNPPGECPNGGRCTSPGVCTCNSGFQTNDNCKDIDECLDDNGGCELDCVNLPGSYYCVCEQQGYGKTVTDTLCKPLCSGEKPGMCANGGVCTSPGACSCQAGYQTPECEDINECLLDNGGCSLNCVNVNGSFECVCQAGYSWDPTDSTCQPVCFGLKVGKCEHGGTCVSSDVCSCQQGFEPPSCLDVDECSIGVHTCDGDCVNTAGYYYCQSTRPGYGTLPGEEKERAICGGMTPGTCSFGGFCFAPNSCHCRDRFIQSQGDCIDINECADSNRCPGSCTNSVGSYTCICDSGYGWDEKENMCKPVCDDYPPGFCQNQGQCTSPGVCVCETGFQQPDCADIDECATNEASVCNNGCTNKNGFFFCNSQRPGYGIIPGETTEKPLCDSAHPPGKCRNGGVCLGPGTCKCPKGFLSPLCADADECDEDIVGCRTCENLVGSYRCDCYPGYEWLSETIQCTAVCYEYPPGSCANGGTCIEPYVCSCPDGYILPQCQDDDECSTDNGGCSHECENTDGSYSCHCEEGYTLLEDKAKCDDDDECEISDGGCIQECINTVGSFKCGCFTGYTIGYTDNDCIDIDECQTENGGCAEICVNTAGSHYCQCYEGKAVSGNGICQPVCYDFPVGTCGEHGVCSAPDLCDCQSGFQLPRCADINECVRNNGRGDCGHDCVNTEGSYYCQCDLGYQLTQDQHHCQDVDECSGWPYPCSHICNNTIGSYTCHCEEGFFVGPDGSYCQKDDPCNIYNGGCPEPLRCANTISGITCDCQHGYKRGSNGKCYDYNECTVHTGQCGQICVNTESSFYCTCRNMFELMSDLRSCQACEDTGTDLNCWRLCEPAGDECKCPQNRYLHHDKEHCVALCPCVNGGYCRTLFPDYQCDCEGTGFRGATCTLPTVDIPSVIRLRVNYQPLQVPVLAKTINSITILPSFESDIKLHPDNVSITSAKPVDIFDISTDKANMYKVAFNLTGPDAQHFPWPIFSTVYAGDIFVREQLLDYELPTGCFKLGLVIFVKGTSERPVKHTLTFLSTSPWYKVKGLMSVKFTHGSVVMIGERELNLPWFSRGLELVVERGEKIIAGPVSAFRKQDTGTETGGKTNPKCIPLELLPEDVFLLDEYHSVLKTLRQALSSRLPAWFSVVSDSITPTYLEMFYPSVLSGKLVGDISSCSDIPVIDSEIYYTLIFTESISIRVFGQIIKLPKATEMEAYCLVLSVHNSTDLFALSFPESTHSNLKELFAIQSLKAETGLDIDLNAIAFSNSGHFPSTRIVTVNTTLWDGERLIKVKNSMESSLWFSMDLSKRQIDVSQNITISSRVETFVSSSDLKKVLLHFTETTDMLLLIKDSFLINLQITMLNQQEELRIISDSTTPGLTSFGQTDEEERQVCGNKSHPEGLFLKVSTKSILLQANNVIANLTFINNNPAYLVTRFEKKNGTTTSVNYVEFMNYLLSMKERASKAQNCLESGIMSNMDKDDSGTWAVANNIESILLDILLHVERLYARNTTSTARDFLSATEDLTLLCATILNNILQLKQRLVLTFQSFGDDIECLHSNATLLQTIVSNFGRNVLQLSSAMLPSNSDWAIKSAMQVTINGLTCLFDGEFWYRTEGVPNMCGRLEEFTKGLKFVPSVLVTGSIRSCEPSGTNMGIWRNFLLPKGSSISMAFSSGSDYIIHLDATLLTTGRFLDTKLIIDDRRVSYEASGLLWHLLPVSLSGSVDISVMDQPDWSLPLNGHFKESLPGSFSNQLEAMAQQSVKARLSALSVTMSQSTTAIQKAKVSYGLNFKHHKSCELELKNIRLRADGTSAIILEAKRDIMDLNIYLKKIGILDNICKPVVCEMHCTQGAIVELCRYLHLHFMYPCLQWDSCSIKTSQISCIAENSACLVLLKSIHQSLNISEANLLLAKLETLIEDVSVLTMHQNEYAYRLKTVTKKCDMAISMVNQTRKAVSDAEVQFEKLKWNNHATFHLQDFTTKKGAKATFDISDCGFEVNIGENNPYTIEIHCHINPFLLGERKVNFEFDFLSIQSSKLDIAHKLVSAVEDAIEGVIKSLNLTRGDRTSFDTINTELRSIVLFNNLKVQERLWKSLCTDYEDVKTLMLESLNLLAQIASDYSENVNMIVKHPLVFPKSAHMDHGSINQTAAWVEYGLSDNDIDRVLAQVNPNKNNVLHTLKYLYNSVKSNTTFAMNSINKASILAVWNADMERLMKEQFNFTKCFGYSDCIKWGLSVANSLTQLVDQVLVEKDIRIISSIENTFHKLLMKNELPLDTVRVLVKTILGLLRSLKLDKLCSPIPLSTTSKIDEILACDYGDGIDLICPVSMNVLSSVLWRKDHSSKVAIEQDKTLSLRNVTLIDQGSYTCLLTNHKGTLTGPELKLTIVQPPTLQSDLDSAYTVINGDNVTLYCNAEGKRPIGTTWKTNSNVKLTNTSMVHMQNVSAAATGIYLCQATNADGEIRTSEMFLKVIQAKPACPVAHYRFSYISGPKAEGITKVENAGLTMREEFYRGLSAVFHDKTNTFNIFDVAISEEKWQGEFSVGPVACKDMAFCLRGTCEDNYWAKYRELQRYLKVLLAIRSSEFLFEADSKYYYFNSAYFQLLSDGPICAQGETSVDNFLCVDTTTGSGAKGSRQFALSAPINLTLENDYIDWKPPGNDAGFVRGYDILVVRSDGVVLVNVTTDYLSFDLHAPLDDQHVTVTVRAFSAQHKGEWAQVTTVKLDEGSNVGLVIGIFCTVGLLAGCVATVVWYYGAKKRTKRKTAPSPASSTADLIPTHSPWNLRVTHPGEITTAGNISLKGREFRPMFMSPKYSQFK